MRQSLPCHYRRLFIDSTGYVWPCCFLYQRKLQNKDASPICHVTDPDPLETLAAYDNPGCACQSDAFVFDPDVAARQVEHVFIVTSMLCNARCAVCYVQAHRATGGQRFDDAACHGFISTVGPRFVQLEGGEVPMQKEAMAFAARLRQSSPQTGLKLITNGNHSLATAKKVSALFRELIVISFMGISESVYAAETCLDAARQRKFVDAVAKSGARYRFRYVITPVSLVDLPAFLGFALRHRPDIIEIAHSNIFQFVRQDTAIPYWNDLVERCRAGFQRALLAGAATLRANGTLLALEPSSRELLRIDADFVAKNGLEDVVISA